MLFRYVLVVNILTLQFSGIAQDEGAVFESLGIAEKEILTANSYLSRNLDSADYWIRKAIKKNANEPDTKGKAIAYGILAEILSLQEQNATAFEYLTLAENSISNNAHPSTKAYISYRKALIFLNVGNSKKAGEEAIKALHNFEMAADSIWLPKAYTLISGIYFQNKEYELSELYITKCIEILEVNNEVEKIAGSYHNQAVNYQKLGELDKAFDFFKKAINLNLKYNNLNWLSKNYHGVALNYKQSKKYDSAHFYLAMADKKLELLANKKDKTELMLARAGLLIEEHRYTEAEKVLNQVLNGAQKNDNARIKVAALKLLYEIDYALDRFKNASDKLEVYMRISDSLNEFKNSSAISIMEKQLEFDAKKNLLELESERLKNKSDSQQILIFTLISIGLVLASFIFLVFKWMQLRQKQFTLEKQELNREIDLKNQELTASTLAKVQHNELLQSLIKKLEKTTSNKEVVSSKAVNTITKEIKAIRSNTIWEEFEVRFKSIHNDFYERLKKEYPNLTPSELKICALLRLNMSTKEISSLLFKSTQSLEVDRARIRKKLGLTNTKENLTLHLMNF